MTYQGWQRWGSLALGVDLHGAPALAFLADLPLAAQQPHPVGEYAADSDKRSQTLGPCTQSPSG